MRNSSDGYKSQRAWRNIQRFLPAEYQLTPEQEPTEEWWTWRGHDIHLDRFVNPSARAKVILFHGLGTNGRQMSTILGAPLFRSGFETISVDMPSYGVTKVRPGTVVTYDDWVQVGNDLIESELRRDPRPIVLYGLSAGGMLTYHVAAVNKKVKGIVGMTFLDQRVPQVAEETARSKMLARIGNPLLAFAVKMGLGSIKVPMRSISKMSMLVNDKNALKAFYEDPTSAGNWVSQNFVVSYINYSPAIEPEYFDACPILLTQPAEDRWTPLHLSELFLNRITHVSVKLVNLKNVGHYPLEQTGLRQMHDVIVLFVNQCCNIL